MCRGGRQGYGLGAFTAEFTHLRRLLPLIPLAGPATGAVSWLAGVPGFLAAEPTLTQVTFHRYPLNRCVTNSSSPQYPTVANLLSPSASRGLMAGLSPDIAATHRAGLIFRVDEMNTVTCQGRSGVSNTFASALWLLDTLFAMARAGVDAVNIHMWPGAVPEELFTFKRRHGVWLGSVRPEYYGIVMFNRAAPSGSQILQLHAAGAADVRSWATRSPDGRVRVLLINDGLADGRTVLVRVPAGAGPAAVERLRAPSARATGGVTLAGQSFGPQSATGALTGAMRTTSLVPTAGGYELTVPAASAAMLTIAGRGR